jgi:threonine aldolase
VLAAAGLYALENNAGRLAEDHRNAQRLAAGLKELGVAAEQHTNMVFARIAEPRVEPLFHHLKDRGVLVLPGTRMRLVTHLDVDAAGIDRALRAFREFFAG